MTQTPFFCVLRLCHFFGKFSNFIKKKWGKVNYIFFLWYFLNIQFLLEVVYQKLASRKIKTGHTGFRNIGRFQSKFRIFRKIFRYKQYCGILMEIRVSRSKCNIKNGVKVFLNHLSNIYNQYLHLQRFLWDIGNR